jgi:hypothetical protein
MTLKHVAVGLVGVGFLVGIAVAEPQAKTYQVTGPVLEVTDTKIVVQKGDEKWEIARDSDTKVTGDLKVGAKVMVEYRMFATKVEVKDDAGAKADADAKTEGKKASKASK